MSNFSTNECDWMLQLHTSINLSSMIYIYYNYKTSYNISQFPPAAGKRHDIP